MLWLSKTSEVQWEYLNVTRRHIFEDSARPASLSKRNNEQPTFMCRFAFDFDVKKIVLGVVQIIFIANTFTASSHTHEFLFHSQMFSLCWTLEFA